MKCIAITEGRPHSVSGAWGSLCSHRLAPASSSQATFVVKTIPDTIPLQHESRTSPGAGFHESSTSPREMVNDRSGPSHILWQVLYLEVTGVCFSRLPSSIFREGLWACVPVSEWSQL